MKAKKIMALLLTAMMVFTLIGCGDTAAVTEETETATTEPEVTEEVVEAVSVDFEDGLFGFMGVDMTAGNADESTLSLEDYNGSKAVKVTVAGGTPYIVLDVAGLLGDAVGDVRTVEMDIALENPDGTFAACSGALYAYSGTELTESSDPWSVYLDTKNPNKAVATLDSEAEYFVAGAGNYLLISKEVDNGATLSNLYIDNIRFLDAEGNVMTVDTAAVYVAPVAAETDWSNLTKIGASTDIEGFAVSADAWAQAGVNTTLNGGTFDAATIVPGSIITINFSGEGNMWLVGVSSGNPKGDWIRIADAGNAPINGSHNIAQITYDQIVAALGEDFATTLTVLQCESDMAWEVYSVSVGFPAEELYNVVGATEIEGFAVSADAWAQAGVPTTLNAGTFDATTIVPGSVITVNYASEGHMWLVGVSAGNPNGDWIRIADAGNAVEADGYAQITYDQIVAALGEDFASTLTALQCESDMPWEVYNVTIGQIGASYKEALNQVEIPDFAVSAEAWAQAGVPTTLNAGTFDATTIVPGSVITITYKSDGYMWLVGVSSGNPNGDWIRIADAGNSIRNSTKDKCQITYDQIVAALGEDFATTLATLQCESDMPWEVYSVTVGTAAE